MKVAFFSLYWKNPMSISSLQLCHSALVAVLLIGIRPWVKLVDCLAKLGHCLTWWIRLKLNHYWTLILSFSFLVIWGLCQIPQPTYDQVKEPDISSPSPMLNSSSTDSEISQHESCTSSSFVINLPTLFGSPPKNLSCPTNWDPNKSSKYLE